MATETFEVSLHGGSPWGFRLQGGKEFRAPLLIARVTPGSKASKQGILVGDLLISINNEPCDDMNHSNALNCVKKSGKNLVLTLQRRPFDSNDGYSYNSLPRGSKLTNGDVTNNNNNDEYKSVSGYVTLPRSKQNKNSKPINHDDEPVEEKHNSETSEFLETRSSSGVSSKYMDDDDELLQRAVGVMSPSSEDWSPDLISDAVRTPEPIRLISENEPDPTQYTRSETTRVKSPTTIHGFTDKPSPVGRGARRNNDEENTDSADYELLTSGSNNIENIPDNDDSGNHSNSPPYSPGFQGRSRPAINHMVKRREGVAMPLPDASANHWLKYHYIDDDRKKKAAEQPYRRYSYHGSVLRDTDSKSLDGTERPKNKAGSGWYKELFKEMHTGAGNSTGLSSLLAGDVSPPPKNDAGGLFKSYRERNASEEPEIRPTKTKESQADPTTSGRFSRPEANIESTTSHRHSMSSFPSATAGVKMREKPTTRSNVPSWYREFQKGKEVSEKEITEDQKHPRGNQAPGSTRSPGNIGPEYPVVKSYSLGTRPTSGPVVHRDPPKQLHTQNYRHSNDVTMAANRYPPATRQAGQPIQKEPQKPSALNFYEDHMKKRQFSPRTERKEESYEPVDYIKQFEEEEEKLREDERRAQEDLERKLREEQKAKEEAERKRREAEQRKKEEMEARKNPKHARALYNFSPQSSKEIGFRKGDIVLFYRSIDANWCEGEAQGQIGLYPISYVEIIEENVPTSEGEGKVKFNFKAESPRELNLQKGDIVAIIRQIDQNWYEGVSNDKVGIFPVSYIEVLREPGEGGQQVPPKQVEEEIVAKQNGLPEVESAVDELPDPVAQEPDISTLEGEKFTVVFTYSPQNEDELELQEGDIVKVVEKCDDGWFVGISERTGEFGTFPGNYVKQL